MKQPNLIKTIFFLNLLISLSSPAFSKTYYTYTAINSGDWDNMANWIIVSRNDGVQRDKFIIPPGYTITADEDVNSLGYLDVELQISGVLELDEATTLTFGPGSRIEVFASGMIQGEGNSQIIYIGGVSKYMGNKNKDLQGPVYADASTGSAPSGFSSFAALDAGLVTFTLTEGHKDHLLRWTAANNRDSSHFEIEESTNGSAWMYIGISQTSNSATTIKNYSFRVKANSAVTYYRLKQVDIYGRYSYSAILVSRANLMGEEFNVFKKGNQLDVQLEHEAKTKVQVRVFNVNGQGVSFHVFQHPGVRLSMQLPAIPEGIYLVQIIRDRDAPVIKRIFID